MKVAIMREADKTSTIRKFRIVQKERQSGEKRVAILHPPLRMLSYDPCRMNFSTDVIVIGLVVAYFARC